MWPRAYCTNQQLQSTAKERRGSFGVKPMGTRPWISRQDRGLRARVSALPLPLLTPMRLRPLWSPEPTPMDGSGLPGNHFGREKRIFMPVSSIQNPENGQRKLPWLPSREEIGNRASPSTKRVKPGSSTTVRVETSSTSTWPG